MATYQPTIRTGTVTFDQLVKQFYGAVDSAAASFSYYIQPNGYGLGNGDGYGNGYGNGYNYSNSYDEEH